MNRAKLSDQALDACLITALDNYAISLRLWRTLVELTETDDMTLSIFDNTFAAIANDCRRIAQTLTDIKMERKREEVADYNRRLLLVGTVPA